MDKGKQEEHIQQFQDFASNAHDILIKVRGVFPLDIFPDEAKLDRQMFTIKRNIFPGISKTVTCHHEDILNSQVNLGPLFGSVTVHMKYITEGEQVIKWLTKDDARRLHAMLQGLLSAAKNGVDLTPLPTSELMDKLEEMGDTT